MGTIRAGETCRVEWLLGAVQYVAPEDVPAGFVEGPREGPVRVFRAPRPAWLPTPAAEPTPRELRRSDKFFGYPRSVALAEIKQSRACGRCRGLGWDDEVDQPCEPCEGRGVVCDTCGRALGDHLRACGVRKTLAAGRSTGQTTRSQSTPREPRAPARRRRSRR